jgi:hypothetical protein
MQLNKLQRQTWLLLFLEKAGKYAAFTAGAMMFE